MSSCLWESSRTTYFVYKTFLGNGRNYKLSRMCIILLTSLGLSMQLSTQWKPSWLPGLRWLGAKRPFPLLFWYKENVIFHGGRVTKCFTVNLFFIIQTILYRYVLTRYCSLTQKNVFVKKVVLDVKKWDTVTCDACWDANPQPPVDRQTPVKTLPWPKLLLRAVIIYCNFYLSFSP